jgi:flavin-dependent dehydrogenase
MPPKTDLVVVGAGPAGLATAIGARLAGMSVTVLERSLGPALDKACGEGLMPDAVARLRDLGVSLSDRGQALCGIRYWDGALTAAAAFPGLPGLGLRRTVLQSALVERAREVGVEIRWSTAVTGLRDDGVALEHGTFPASIVVGADGLHSRIRTWAGLSSSKRSRLPLRFGVRRHYAVAPWSEDVEVHFGPSSEAYVTPVGPAEVGVALLWSGRKARFDGLLAGFPALEERLAAVPRTTRDRGAGPLLQEVAGVQRGRVALVGDAAGYLDAITGEGIAVALHQSAALVVALASGRPETYTAALRRIGRLPLVMTRLVLGLDRRPALRRRAIAALAAEPGVFSRLLGIHARSVPARQLGALSALRLLARVGVA